MKIKLLALFISICAAYNAHAQNVTYDSLRTAIVKFLCETEIDFTDRGDSNILLIRDDISHYQIGDERDFELPNYKMGSEPKEGIYSIFPMSSFSEYTDYHFLLVGRDGFQIVNIDKPLIENLKLVIEFLQNNPCFTKEQSLLYLQDFIATYQGNPSV
jgi:hypothetical protein